jgi:hypothetical protein
MVMVSGEVVFLVQHIHAALENARPSLSKADRDAMDRRFDKFRTARDSQKMSPFSKESEAAKQSLTEGNAMKVALKAGSLDVKVLFLAVHCFHTCEQRHLMKTVTIHNLTKIFAVNTAACFAA